MNGPWIDAYPEERSLQTAFAPAMFSYDVGGATTADPVGALNASSGYSTAGSGSLPSFSLLNERVDASTVQTRVDQIVWPLILDFGWLQPPWISPLDWPTGAVDYEYEYPVVTVNAATLQGTLRIANTSGQPSAGRLIVVEDDSWVTITEAAAAPVVAETATASSGTSQDLTLAHDVVSYLQDDGAGGLIAYLLAYPTAAVSSGAGYSNWPPSIGSGDSVNVFALGSGGSNFFGGTAAVTVPRHRFLFDVIPPLRQFPRGDNLVGTGGVRQRSAGSRQASNRQGWNGTYLRAGWAAG